MALGNRDSVVAYVMVVAVYSPIWGDCTNVDCDEGLDKRNGEEDDERNGSAKGIVAEHWLYCCWHCGKKIDVAVMYGTHGH